MVKAIIFDCFGVLIEDALHGIVNQYGDPEKKREIQEILRLSSRGLLKLDNSSVKMAEILGISDEEFKRLMSKGEIKNSKLLTYIKELRKKYKTAILSNVRPGGLADRFSDEELKEHFDVVIGSGDIGYAKPDTEAYAITAKALGVNLDECLAVDDKESYCSAAKALGMEAVLYKSFDQMKRDIQKILDR